MGRRMDSDRGHSCGLVLLVLAVTAPTAAAGDFRVETDVFVGDQQKDPVVETLTIFQGDVVFDFLRSGPEEITVFDHARDRLVLLDPQRKVKTELTKSTILAVMAEMQVKLQQAGPQKADLLGSALKARWSDGNQLELGSNQFTYRAEGMEAKDAEAANRYQEFADWYARLNAMRPGNPPPFARLRLNQELASHQLLPKTVTRILVRRQGLHEVRDEARSRHLVTWRLSQTDRKAVDRASSYLATFRSVSLSQYLGLD